ncbi:MAG: Fic family protein [Proteobacteria bacterium]|nr:Fic family protein [Pseudomonadota bacterium]
MEPLLLSETSRHRGVLQDMALELATKAAGFRRSLPAKMQASLADMVRTMNCYYSNLIEGHDTHPISAERAMNNDYSHDPKKRDLQLEARAHITVQKWVDEGNLKGAAFQASSLCEIHRRFCDLLPEEMLWIEDHDTNERIPVVAGELRHRDVAVGDHIAISPGAVPRFLERFENVFSRLGKSEAILASAAAHHRFLWIHPFLDGNGRVARLMSHAVFLDVLDTGGLWSIARGLAKNVKAYKTHLANCDLPRRNDLDGRGNLSEEALADFTRFFLEICLDQVTFMESLMQPDRLRARILMWAEEEIRLGEIPAQAGQVLEAVLYRGELPRADIPGILNVGDRQARRLVSSLMEKNVLVADTQKSPLYLKFPATLASRWMPGLFPEKTDAEA